MIFLHLWCNWFDVLNFEFDIFEWYKFPYSFYSNMIFCLDTKFSWAIFGGKASIVCLFKYLREVIFEFIEVCRWHNEQPFLKVFASGNCWVQNIGVPRLSFSWKLNFYLNTVFSFQQKLQLKLETCKFMYC